jgi:hypothetical protein
MTKRNLKKKYKELLRFSVREAKLFNEVIDDRDQEIIELERDSSNNGALYKQMQQENYIERINLSVTDHTALGREQQCR